MSYFLLKEVPSRTDLLFMTGLFISVFLIILGYFDHDTKFGWLPLFMCIVGPISSAYGNILNRKMKDLRPYTSPIYVILGQVFIIGSVIPIRGKVMATYKLMQEFQWLDWFLLGLTGALSCIF